MKVYRSLVFAALAAGLAACGGNDEPAAVQAHVHIYPAAPVVADEEDQDQSVDPVVQKVLEQAQDIDAGTHSVQGIEVPAPDSFLGDGVAAPAADITVFTPQQIRSAYRMPELPADFTNLTAAQRAELGAGQTIYVIAAYHSPNLIADLGTFARQFNLPGCTKFNIPTTFAPLAPHDPNKGCEIAEVNLKVAERMVTTPPAYVRSWAVEQTLDVQWAHATAPLARIVVVKAPNSFVNSLMSGVMLSERFGPGIMSMSFVAAEDRWSRDYETLMPKDSRITMVAAAGDRGSQANWPSSSPQVISVTGTSLRYDGVTERRENAWLKTGGGYSSIFPAPDYQSVLTSTNYGLTGAKSFVPNARARSSGDVSFNADPATGQYVAFTEPGKTLRWYSYGGTSIGTPQWAGIIAIANAQRALQGKQPVGNIHHELYSGQLSAGLRDVSSGYNGTCTWCYAESGYDTPTGWGTPDVDLLLPALAGL